MSNLTALGEAQAATLLRRANAVAQRAMDMGRHPFGALLVAPDGQTVLAEQGNIDTVNHCREHAGAHGSGQLPRRLPGAVHQSPLKPRNQLCVRGWRGRNLGGGRSRVVHPGEHGNDECGPARPSPCGPGWQQVHRGVAGFAKAASLGRSPRLALHPAATPAHS